MDPLIFGLFAVAYIASLILGFKKHSKTASAILFLTIIGLIYDNGVLAIGHLIGEGTLLENLNLGRFWIHALFTPTLLLFSLFILREAGIHIAFKTWFVVSFVVLWIVATIVEIIVEIRGLELTVQESYGVLSYAAVETASGPPPMILIVLIGLLIAGILLAWKKKWWWMLVGTIAMIINASILTSSPLV